MQYGASTSCLGHVRSGIGQLLRSEPKRGSGPAVRASVRRSRYRLIAGLFAIASFFPLVASALAPAGITIGNQAAATYVDSDGKLREVTSNLVETVVSQVFGVLVAPDDTTTTSAGNLVNIPFSVTNTGNGADQFDLSLAQSGADNFNCVSPTPQAFPDADRNGIPDDLNFPVTNTGTMLASEVRYFVMTCLVPDNVSTGDRANVDITGVSVSDPSATDDARKDILVDDTSFELSKALSPDAGPAGASPVQVTLTYRNTGTEVSDLELSDALPAGMAYITNSGRWSVTGNQALTDLDDEPTNKEDEGQGSDLIDYQYQANSRTVVAYLTNVAPGASGTVSFSISIASDAAAGSIVNIATFDDGSGGSAGSSNEAPFVVGVANNFQLTDPETAGIDNDVINLDQDDIANDTVTIQTAGAGSFVEFSNVLLHNGNTVDTFDIAVNSAGSSFPAGTQFILFDGNGTPLTDSDASTSPGFGQVDTGPVQPGDRFVIILRAILPQGVTDSNAGVLPPYRVSKTATSTNSPSMSDSVTDSLVSIALDNRRVELFIEKSVTPETAFVGDFVRYTVEVRNPTGQQINSVKLLDAMPFGFAYVKGSARIGEVEVNDPEGGAGPLLEFPVGPLASDTSVTFTYAAKLGPGALRSSGVNTVTADGRSEQGNTVTSNTATATVRVEQGVFNDRGHIIGKVYTDCNFNHVQDAEEIGIPGVRIYMQDGTYSVTDAEGMYSFYGLPARTHVVHVDSTTLPRGSELKTLDNRNAGVATSRFVDLKFGELHKADFAEGGCAESVIELIKARREKGEIFRPEIEKAIETDLIADRDRYSQDVRSRPSSGLVREDEGIDVSQLSLDENLNSRNSVLADKPVDPNPIIRLEDRIKDWDNSFAFVDLKDGDAVARRKLNIRLKGKAGTGFRLSVNGQEIADHTVGKKTQEGDVQAWEYVSVELKEGVNSLNAEQLDQSGNVRETSSISVRAPSGLAKFEMEVQKSPVADGLTVTPVIVRLVDENGAKVTAWTPVTLEVDTQRWDVEDLDPVQRGWQTFIEGGEAIYGLIPPVDPGSVNVRISSGLIQVEDRIAFVPDLRPLLAVGVIEGQINLSKLGEDSIVPTSDSDAFEEELRNWSTTSNDGKVRAGARATAFLKGKVMGKYLLTASFDSEKEDQERLFRDIRPDEFYPVYGDSAVKGFDAQSTGKLYVRVDKNRSYLLYGDYSTNDGNSSLGLASYGRSLTGLKHHYETENISVNTFASYDNARQQVSEFEGNGTSGPYPFPTNISNVVRNSEKIEIIVRDRQQPSIILVSNELTRFRDYQIDYANGRIIFASPITRQDSELNPVTIRVTYEMERGGDEFLVAGVNAQANVTDNVIVGGSFIHDDDPEREYQLAGINAEVKLGDRTTLQAEYAHSFQGDERISDTSGTALTPEQSERDGGAYRVELRHQGDRWNGRAHYSKTDEAFTNSNASQLSGREEGGLDLSWRITDSTRISGEALRSKDNATNGGTTREGASLAVEQSVGDFLRFEVGARTSRIKQSGDSGSDSDVDSLRGRITASAPASWPRPFKSGEAYVEYEQDISDTEDRRTVVGLEAYVAERTRLYATHELQDTLNTVFENTEDRFGQDTERTNTVIGFDTDYSESGRLFSEYRIRSGQNGRESEASYGVRNAWQVKEGLRLDGTFEQIRTISSSDPNAEGQDSWSATGGVEYTGNPLWKLTGRLEYRHSRNDETWFNTLGVGRKLSRNWVFLGKNSLSFSDADGPNNRRVEERLQLGLAYRSVDNNRWNGLFRYELEYGRDQSQSSRTLAHLFSTHVNYQPSQSTLMSGRYAVRWSDQMLDGIEEDFWTQLVSGRFTWDFTERWDMGLNASTLFDDDALYYGLGAEVGYLLYANLWASVGYNLFGYEDDRLAGGDYTNPGFYLRFRYKFDETLFSGSDPRVNNSLEPR